VAHDRLQDDQRQHQRAARGRPAARLPRGRRARRRQERRRRDLQDDPGSWLHLDVDGRLLPHALELGADHRPAAEQRVDDLHFVRSTFETRMQWPTCGLSWIATSAGTGI
jgi:hypothetical protein